ncbi:alpha/beta hydrolase [Cohnella endophytica]|uniref:alpha/beta hydrolase n=1 Tax=Cohnella endophytica TaxID=2419778 RepID=UPI001F37BEED|nr:alpha/beta hydrolase [Cohnella endophytica]
MYWFIPILIVLVFIAIAGSSLYFYHIAVARSDKSFLSRNPDLEIDPGGDQGNASESPFAANEAWWNRQVFADWSIRSDEGFTLRAYYLTADRPTNKTAILAHGYSGQANQMASLVEVYQQSLGYNVLIPDARGHGRSDGTYIGFGWPERKDYVKWIDEVIRRTGDETQIVLHGVSMGAATVMMASGERLPSNVKAVVEDCGYTSVKDQLAYQLNRMYRMPAFPMIPATSLLTKLRAGYSFQEASALAQVKKSNIPTLFIHGDADTFVPTRMVHELYASSPADKKLFVVHGAGHGLARFNDPAAYDREVAQFIGHYVK